MKPSLLVALWLPLVLAVFVHDAFVRDWVHHRVGPVLAGQVAGPDSVYGVTESELVKLDLNNTVAWKVDFNSFPSPPSQFVVDGSNLYGVSDHVYLWNAEGQLVQSWPVAPLKIKPCARGLVALEDKTVKLLTKHGDVVVVKENVSDFEVDHDSTIVYTDGSILAIDYTNTVTESAGVAVKRIKAVGHDVVVADHIGRVGNLQLAPAKCELAAVLSSDYIADYTKGVLSIKKITGTGVETVYTETIGPISQLFAAEYSLRSVLVASGGGQVNVYDVSDFLTTDDVSTLEKTTHAVAAEFDSSFSKSAARLVFNKEQSDFELVLLDISDKIVVESHMKDSSRVSTYDFEPRYSKHAILIDKPQSLTAIDKAHHLIMDSHSLSVFTNWLTRSLRHLSEIGRLVSSRSTEPLLEDVYGFGKLLVYVDETSNKLVVIDTETSNTIYTNTYEAHGEILGLVYDGLIHVLSEGHITSFDLRQSAKLEQSVKFDHFFTALLEDGSETLVLKQKNSLLLTQLKLGNISHQYITLQLPNGLQGYKVTSTKLVPTWNFLTEEAIVSVAKKPQDSVTSSVGISRFDKSVIYKYLNPNTVSVITFDGSLHLYLLDAITGNLLYTTSTDEEKIDVDSVQLIQDDNWVIFSYFVNSPQYEQRITVVDLFDSPSKAASGKVSVLNNYNSSVDSVSSKSFIFPERIVKLASTQTKHGITLKSILALTGSGSLIELPKFLLNSRRIDDRPLTQQDFQDEFRMVPYEPVLFRNSYQVLSHKHKLALDKDTKILVKATELESTSVVCLVNKHQEFCTSLQPSLSYDILNANFDRLKLILTIGALFVAYLVTKPMVYSKKLEASWIDR